MNQPVTEAKAGPKGAYFVTHRRCLPGQEALYHPKFNAIGEAILAGATQEELAPLYAELAQHQYEVGLYECPNVVTNGGRNDILDKYLKGSAYTQTIRMGLAGTGTKAAADTQASHAGWLEVGLANAPTYSGSRPSITMGSASSQSSVSPATNFSITSSGTVSGCFINNGGSATKDDTTGTLFSAGNFTGGDKVVANTDTLSVTYTLNG